MPFKGRIACLTVGLLASVAIEVDAGEVRIKGVHLCCGSCVAGVDEALDGLAGVDGVAADRNAKVVTFTAENAAAARSGIDALAKAGFHGTATHDGEPVAFPDSGAKEGAKVKRLVVSGVHLCCGACVTGAQKALENVEGVEAIEIDRKERVVRMIGKDIDEVAGVAALNAGGFHGTVVREKD